ncbi:MAG: GNAT family N-acetyltransferase [Chloroflexota bacterium]|nr:GNAT family N-acetyltransferase [Chloroflexota bacterium]
MSIPATIRRAHASDAPAIASLIQRYVPSGTLLPRSPEFIAEQATDFLVATLDGRVIGCVHLYEYSPSLAEIRSLAVDPTCQGRGVGVALVDAVEHLAGQREYATLFAVSQNETFFRSRGYMPREIPELDRERSEVSRFKGVYAKEVADRSLRPAPHPNTISCPAG